MNMNSHTTANLSSLAGLCRKSVYVINHVSRNQGCAFGMDPQDGECVYIHGSYLNDFDIVEGDLVECVVVPNHAGKREDTRWRCISMKHMGSMHDHVETVVQEPLPVEPEVPLEDRVFEVFEENPDTCFTSREVCETVFDQKGVNTDVRDILRKMHREGDICMLRIKTKASNKRGTVLWGLQISSFGFNDVEGDDEEVEVYES
jgi:hypothetical protein